MRQTVGIKRVWLLVGLLGVAASACGSDSEERSDATATSSAAPSSTAVDGFEGVVEAAESEGAVTVYAVTAPNANDAAEAAFEELHPGIDVEFVRLNAGELEQRADAERAGNVTGADVLIGLNSGWFGGLAEEEDLIELSGPNTLAVAEDADLVRADGFVVMSVAGTLGFAWNTQAVDGELELEDLLDDRFSGGRLGTYDINTTPAYVLWNYLLEESSGDDELLSKIADQDPVTFPSTVPMLQALAAGQIDAAVYAVLPAVPEGAPIEVRFPERPVTTPFWTGIAGWAAHPNAAQVFVDWLHSPEGQEVWTADQSSVIPDVQSAQFYVKDTTMADASDHPPAFIEEESARQQALFG